MRRGALIFVSCLFFLSLCSLALFVWYVNPAYLDFSGFCLFYVILAVWLWTFFLIVGHVVFGRTQRRGRQGGALARRSALLAVIVASGVFFSQINISLYVFAGLCAALVCVEFMLARR